MKVLITGGAGFIGHHVARLLVERGDEVRVSLRPGESDAPLKGLGCQTAVADVRDLPSVIRAVRGCDAVIHMAAIYSLWMKDWRPLYQVNVQGTRNVLDACRREGVSRVVHTSSIAAVGVEAGERPATEETLFNQHGRAGHYVLSKHYSERVAIEFAEAGLPVTIVNPAFPTGIGDRRPTPTGRILLRIVTGAFFLHGPGGLNVVDVEDVARGHLLALDAGQPGRRYLLSGHDVTHAQLFEEVKRIGGVDRRHLRLPRWALAPVGWGGDVIGRWREPLIDSVTLRYSSQCLFYDNTRARTELGWTVTPLEESLERSIEWFRARGYLAPDAGWRLRRRG
jgi:dihydroflavonol-4-reductase